MFKFISKIFKRETPKVVVTEPTIPAQEEPKIEGSDYVLNKLIFHLRTKKTVINEYGNIAIEYCTVAIDDVFCRAWIVEAPDYFNTAQKKVLGKVAMEVIANTEAREKAEELAKQIRFMEAVFK